MDIFFNKLKNIVIFNLLIAILLPFTSSAQTRAEIDSIVKAKVANYVKSDLAFQGRLNINSDINSDFTNNKQFFNYKIQSNLQANIYGVSVPLSFSFSNGRTSYGYALNPIQLPTFNRIGLSPKYKDLTFHLGYRQLQYTKYTLSNVQFKGIGFEYQPTGYYFSAMKGSLKPAIAEDNLDVSLLEPSFLRNTWALKAGIERESISLGFAFITIKDDPLSLKSYENYQKPIHPRENAVVGAYLKKTLFQNVNFDIDYAFSGLSYDIVNDPFLDIGTQYTAYNYFGLFTTRNNSIYDKAFNSSISYDFNKYRIALKIERVDPHFRSMGSFFFNNNFVTRTGHFSGQTLKDKLQFNIELGTEDKAEIDITEKEASRFIGATGLKYKLTDNLSLNAKYSNMNNSSYVRKPSLQSSLIDSILQTQTKEKISLGSNYLFGKDRNQSISLFTSYQRGIIVDNDQFLTSNTSTTKNAGLTYSISSEKATHSLSYNIAKINDSSNMIATQSIIHSYSTSISKTSNLFSNTSINFMNSDRTKNFIVQNEIGIDKNYLRLHKIKSSIGTQIGRNTTDQTSNNIFLVVIKITYDIAVNYRK